MNKDGANFSLAQELAHIYLDHPSISQRSTIHPVLHKIILGTSMTINDSSTTISPYPPTRSEFLCMSQSVLFQYAI